MKKLLPLFPLIFFCMLLCTCRKDAHLSELPPVTEEGKNTFGCKINGQVWVPFFPCSQYSVGIPEMTYSFPPVFNNSVLPMGLYIGAGNTNNGHSDFSITLNRYGSCIPGKGNIIDSLLIRFTSASFRLYYSDKGHGAPHQFEITKLDTVNKIVSGIFNFTVYANGPNPADLDSMVVTEGRFDLQLTQDYFKCSN